MTQKVNPSINRKAEAFKSAGAIALAGGSSSGWISPATDTSDLTIQDGTLDETVMNAFAETSSGTSFDVTIDSGEAFVYGSWLAIDVSTTVTLASSTANQTVYVGWNKDGIDDVIIGLSAAFSSASGDTDEKIPLYDFDTDGSGVTAVTDRRQIGQYINIDRAEIASELDVPTYSDSTNAPQDIGGVIYVDGGGTQGSGIYVHNGSSYNLANLKHNDGIAEVFGTDGDFSQRFDATNDDLRWQDETNAIDRMALDRTTGNVTITGTITESTSI